MLTIYMLRPSADNLCKHCKHFGTRRDPTQRRALSASNLFDILMVILICFFVFLKKVNFEINEQTTKRSKTILSMQIVKVLLPNKSDAS